MAWLGLYIVTFNCARNQVQPDLFASHLFDVLPKTRPQSLALPEILVLSLQEISPIGYAFLGGSFLDPYFDALGEAVDLATGEEQYTNIITKNIGMTAIMVFVRQDVLQKISWTATAEVGVGVHEAGNKGAVAVRLGYLTDTETTETVDLTFVAAHLAPDEVQVERRNEDWKSVCQRLVFTSPGEREGSQAHNAEDDEEEDVPLLQQRAYPSTKESGVYSPGSYLFVAGDLNYRTSDIPPGLDGHKLFPRNVEDAENPHHFSHRIASDQLTRELQAQRTLHNLTEMPITFAPTYKFSSEACEAAGHDALGGWQWAKKRWPSWCDRILFLDASGAADASERLQAHAYDSLPLFPTSDHRGVALSVSVPLKPVPPPAAFVPPFEIDPDWKVKRATARRKELVVGIIAYLGLTWEGNGLIVATSLAVLGGYIALRSFLAS
ncbi:hypothetical protein AJ80_08364 [Polytolypa hystricis UAMH7299]|uniref:Inositol polyphosphate-related phosphatase domain-containing protein n=1 Tax=Polytolypa hystricis (strain UAMH7299) TaxID=1447883 RepID=A0A2B7X865_POLH7|nr:hypothetical protein AJ80_08364 [Polytolypa hystricis UAMH7299]